MRPATSTPNWYNTRTATGNFFTSQLPTRMKSLQKLETAIIAILVLIFLVWSYDACSARRKRHQPQEPPVTEQPTTQPTEQPAQPTTDPANSAAPTTAPTTSPVTTQPAQPTATAAAFSTVYVHINGLKLRDKATLSGSQVLAELPKGSALYYLNNKTTYNDQITLDNVTYNEPWIEVQTTDSRQLRGWIYAGGVRFYQ